MRTRRILVVAAAVVLTGLAAAPPASAGNWEETLLDPPPARVEAGVTYTFGYWILQHGSYPFQGGDLGPTGLRATDEKGEAVEFPGVAARTAGHYTAEVVFPHDGRWTIGSQHGVIMPDDLVATVTVPGPVSVAPSVMRERAPYEWGAVRPSFPPAASDAEMAPPVTGEVEPRGHVTDQGTDASVWWLAAGGVVTVGLVWWLVRRRVSA